MPRIIKVLLMTIILFPFVLIIQRLLTGQLDVVSSIIISVGFGFILPFIWDKELKDHKQRYFKLTNFPYKLEEGEEIKIKDFAAYFVFLVDVEGILFITNHRLVFDPFKYNIVKNEFEILLENIAEISTYHILGLSNNGVRIQLKSGEVKKFAMDMNEEHVRKIKELMAGVET